MNPEEWAGRISLQVASEPPQSFSASFGLKGRAENGELTLISPLGNVLAVLRWSPGQALLDRGNQDIQRFASIDELMERATGAAIPLNALFAWLQGNNATASGWVADLTCMAKAGSAPEERFRHLRRTCAWYWTSSVVLTALF